MAERLTFVLLPHYVWHATLFALLQYAASLYAILRGGKPERYVGIALVVAMWASLASRGDPLRFVDADRLVAIVDAMLLAFLVGIALVADRRWPVAMAALHAMTMLAQLSALAGIRMPITVYGLVTIAWSYPMVLLLIIATWRHGARNAHGTPERDWSAVPLHDARKEPA